MRLTPSTTYAMVRHLLHQYSRCNLNSTICRAWDSSLAGFHVWLWSSASVDITGAGQLTNMNPDSTPHTNPSRNS